jgi:hypothetical protein
MLDGDVTSASPYDGRVQRSDASEGEPSSPPPDADGNPIIDEPSTRIAVLRPSAATEISSSRRGDPGRGSHRTRRRCPTRSRSPARPAAVAPRCGRVQRIRCAKRVRMRIAIRSRICRCNVDDRSERSILCGAHSEAAELRRRSPSSALLDRAVRCRLTCGRARRVCGPRSEASSCASTAARSRERPRSGCP